MDPEWKGSLYNVLVQWEDGTETWEPLNLFCKDDPVTCANYAVEKDLLTTRGWTKLRRYAKSPPKKLARMTRQLNLARDNRGPKFKFGVEVPRDWRHARQLQEKAGHTKWTDAEGKELGQLYDYETFIDKGLTAPIPSGFRQIRVHFVYDVRRP